MFFDQTFKNIKRTRQIIFILIKYGFEDVVANTALGKVIPNRVRIKWLRQNRAVLDFTRWERIRMAAEELGPTFIKFAQVLANRPDLLPIALINELQKLQSQVAPFLFKEALEIIERETNKPWQQTFSEIDEQVLGAASIGQVHAAKLLSGEEVVVKVQRPNIRSVIETDIEILKEVVRRGEDLLERQGVINAMDVVNAFEKSMLKELNYQNEARNLQQFASIAKSDRRLVVPKVYKAVSTDKILIIEKMGGCNITDINTIKSWGLKTSKVAEDGIDIYLKQIFETGIFHADPHPGNILIQPDGKICLLDYGMVGKLMKKDKYAFAGILIAMAKEDPWQMAINFKRLAIEDEIADMKTLVYDLNEIIEDFARLDVQESSMAELSMRLQKVMFDYRMKIPAGVFLVLRALAILEGIGKMIHPSFNTQKFVKPYGRKIIEEQISAKNIAEDLIFRFNDFSSMFLNLPNDLRTILRAAKQGKLRMEYKHVGYEPMLHRIDSMINRSIVALLIFGLIIGSSIIMLADVGTEYSTISGVPYISIAGLSAAGLLMLILLYAIYKSRRY